MYKALRAIMEGSMVERFHTCSTIHRNTVGQHSHGVACLIWLLCEPDSPPRAELLMAALTHDLEEAVLGDIPSPAKQRMGISDLVHSTGAKLMREVGLSWKLTDDELRLLKMADILDGMLYCAHERGLGNRHIEEAYGNFRMYWFEFTENKCSTREHNLFLIIDTIWKGVYKP